MMPPEWYAIDGARLASDLKARRDALPEVAAKYHEHLAGRVDVRLTNKTERVEASRRANGDTEVTVHVLGPDGQPGPQTLPPRLRREGDGARSASTRTTATTR